MLLELQKLKLTSQKIREKKPKKKDEKILIKYCTPNAFYIFQKSLFKKLLAKTIISYQ